MRYIFLIVLVFSISCKEKDKNAEDQSISKMEQVMMIHDEIMPKMGKLSHLASQLKTKVDTAAASVEYEQAIVELQDANKEMMDWMREFSNRFDSDEILKGKALSEQKQEWLNEEEAKIKALQDKFETSIQKVENLLKNNS
jgi:membrane-bound lytic murein transglycosylase B